MVPAFPFTTSLFTCGYNGQSYKLDNTKHEDMNLKKGW